MSVSLAALAAYLDQLLQPADFSDYCPNGIQVEGRAQVQRVATGVTACQQLLDEAVAWGADAILVHHGYFWRGESQPVVGMKRRRLATLLSNEVSLLAYHLPLDAHPRLGNNATLGQLMGIPCERHQPLPGASVGSIADLEASVTAAELLQVLERELGRRALYIGEAEAPLQRIAWCTGGAQDYIGAALAAGADIYITGESSEQTVHVAREEGIGFVAAGHHATERYGVQAVGEDVSAALGVEHRFFDIDNPV